MKKLYISLATSALLYGVDTPPAPSPESVGLQLQKLEEIDKSVKNVKKTAIVDKLKVDKSIQGKGQNNIKAKTFILKNVSITGNTIMKNEDIIAIVKPFVGKPVSSVDLKYISAKITELYKEKGYLTSECIIPAQKVKNGLVRFQIKEDKLGRIILKGKTTYNYNTNIFMRYLQDLQGKIINANELNTQLKYLSNLPVTRIRPSLQKTPNGYTNLVLNIEEGQEKFSILCDNSGSRYTGEYRVTLNGNLNNIMGKSDSLNLSFTTVENPKYLTSFSSSYVTPIGREGARLLFGFSYMYYQLNPNEVGSDTIIYEGDTSIFSLTFAKPLYILDNTNISYTYGFEKKSVTSQTIQNSNGEVLVDGNDETFVLNGSISLSKADKYFTGFPAVTSINFNVKKALEGFFNSMTQEDLTRKENDTTFPISGPIKYGAYLNPSFLKYYYSIKRQQQLPYSTILNLNFSGNYTKDRVPDSYEYSGGDFGYNYNLSLNKKLWKINSSLSLSQSKVYTNELDGSTSSYETSPSMGISLNSTYKDIYISASYSSSLDNWDSNTNNIRYSLRYSW